MELAPSIKIADIKELRISVNKAIQVEGRVYANLKVNFEATLSTGEVKLLLDLSGKGVPVDCQFFSPQTRLPLNGSDARPDDFKDLFHGSKG